MHCCYNPRMSSVTLAANWAEAVSAVAATAGVLATLLVGWWGWRAAVPHRKAAYSIEFTPLLSSTHSGLTVNLDSERIEHPHTATLKVANVGNREIKVDDFNGESVDFGMNARIVSVLRSRSTDSRRVPPVSIHGNTLQLDPYVIHKKQEIVYKLLLDGSDPRLTLRHSLSGSLKMDRREKTDFRGWVVAAAAATSIFAALSPVVNDVFHENIDAKNDRQVVKQDQRKWYEKGKRDGERLARQSGRAGSPSAKSSPSPSRD